MIDKLMQAVQTLMITSVTRHQQRFSMRNIEIKGRNNVAPNTPSGQHGAYLEETLKQGWRCAESWLVNACFFIE
jgi:hypothetical protein